MAEPQQNNNLDTAKNSKNGLKSCEPDDYLEHFNPEEYLIRYRYLENPAKCAEEELIPWTMDTFHKMFSGQVAEGRRLLDIGTGPTLSNLTSASRVYQEILCSELIPANRKEFVAAISKIDTYKLHDWTPHFKRTAQLEGKNSKDWREIYTRLQNCVTGMIPCNVKESNPLTPCWFRQYDCVSSSFVLEVASGSEEEFRQLVKNCTSLLRPGGMWIQCICLGCRKYNPGADFICFAITEKQLRDSLASCGLEITQWEYINDPDWTDKDYSDGFVILKAFKQL